MERSERYQLRSAKLLVGAADALDQALGYADTALIACGDDGADLGVDGRHSLDTAKQGAVFLPESAKNSDEKLQGAVRIGLRHHLSHASHAAGDCELIEERFQQTAATTKEFVHGLTCDAGVFRHQFQRELHSSLLFQTFPRRYKHGHALFIGLLLAETKGIWPLARLFRTRHEVIVQTSYG